MARASSVIGTATLTVLVSAFLIVACSPADPPTPPLQDAVWDGEQFVIHNQAYGDDSAIWTSADGLAWQRSDEFTMAALPFACHPDHPCDLDVTDVEAVPFHFAEPWSRALAGHGDVVIHEVGATYDVTDVNRDLASEGVAGASAALHPQFLALADGTSDCFAELAKPGLAEPDQPADRTFVERWEWSPERFSATCTGPGGSDTFTVDFGEVLTPEQRQLIERGAPRRMVVTNGQSMTPIADPPTRPWRGEDETERGDPGPSPIVASSDRFWSIDGDELVSSVDGIAWSAAAVDLDGLIVDEVLANPGGDVALALRPDSPTDQGEPSTMLMTSHDDGRTWSKAFPAPAPFWWLVDVGPGAVAVLGADTDKLFVVDDASGSVILTLDDRIPGLLADIGIGDETIIVPQVVQGPDGFDGGGFEVYDRNGRLLGPSG